MWSWRLKKKILCRNMTLLSIFAFLNFFFLQCCKKFHFARFCKVGKYVELEAEKKILCRNMTLLSIFPFIKFFFFEIKKKSMFFSVRLGEVAWFLHANSGLPGPILKCLTSKHIRKTSGIRISYRRAQRNAATRTRTLFKTRISNKYK